MKMKSRTEIAMVRSPMRKRAIRPHNTSYARMSEPLAKASVHSQTPSSPSRSTSAPPSEGRGAWPTPRFVTTKARQPTVTFSATAIPTAPSSPNHQIRNSPADAAPSAAPNVFQPYNSVTLRCGNSHSATAPSSTGSVPPMSTVGTASRAPDTSIMRASDGANDSGVERRPARVAPPTCAA